MLAIYHKDNRKRDRRRWGRRLWHAGLTGMVLLAAAAGIHWRLPLANVLASFRAFILANPYFAVREIQMNAEDKLGGSEIVAMTGLREGMNIWDIEPANIEKKIAGHPWVRGVVVRRDFPSRVVIDVELRKPRAIIAIGKLYYVDSDGAVFKEVAPGDNVNLPILTGLSAEELRAPGPSVRRKILEAIRLGDLMDQGGHRVSEIHRDAAGRLILYTTDFPVPLHMGNQEWEAKVHRLNRVVPLWKGKEDQLAALDFSFRDQVVARLQRTRMR